MLFRMGETIRVALDEERNVVMPWYFPVRVLPQCRGFLPVAVFFALLFCLFPAATPEAQAAQVTVAWDADSNPDVAGYKVYVGTASRNYSLFYDVGKVFRCTIPDLQEGTTFYFAATARDGYGHESDFSEELVYQVPRSDEVPIVPVNHAPVARNGVFSTAHGTPGSGVLIATDPDGDILTYAIAGQGTKGTAAITNAAGGTYLYTPNAGASGSDSFTFQVRDPGNLTSTATIAVTITPGNQPPVAGNGALSTVQNTPAAGKLTATDANGDPLTYQVVRAAKLGSVALNAATGSFTYTPNANSSGADTFTFKANDGKADSNVASFTVTVNAQVNVMLEAEQGALTAPMVLATDTKASGGKYIWVPNGTGNLTDPLAAGGQAVYSFNIPAAGNYRVWGRVIANTVSDNSFFISMDYGAECRLAYRSRDQRILGVGPGDRLE